MFAFTLSNEHSKLEMQIQIISRPRVVGLVTQILVATHYLWTPALIQKPCCLTPTWKFWNRYVKSIEKH